MSVLLVHRLRCLRSGSGVSRRRCGRGVGRGRFAEQKVSGRAEPKRCQRNSIKLKDICGTIVVEEQ